jgi:L-seryl-tRNA(Ser) seleniumtransferase
MTQEPISTPEGADPRRGLPSVAVLLEFPDTALLLAGHPRSRVVKVLREALDSARARMAQGGAAPDAAGIVQSAALSLAAYEFERLRPVINATGIILHTGLGRAVLPGAAVAALAGINRCCNLQIDLDTGKRGKRNFMSEQLLCELTGAEAAMVVNNNAAATLLILAALCAGREVIVSRGQLIEIGGSYRLPDCVHQSGAQLVEAGTTNKTHLRDYAAALTENTAALMRVNPSNYRVVGFMAEVSIKDLVSLKKDRDLLVIDDLGCGALIGLERFGLDHEPTVSESIAAGADLVCFSGDKLIGGPQAGIIVGRADLIRRIRKHPLTRMLRVDKMTDLALEHTLRLFLEPDKLPETNPTYAMLAVKPETLRRRAQALKKRIERGNTGIHLRIIEGESALGGGALPAVGIPTWLLAVSAPGQTAESLAGRLRRHEPPVIGRIAEDVVLLDMRTLLPGEDLLVAEAVIASGGNGHT